MASTLWSRTVLPVRDREHTYWRCVRRCASARGAGPRHHAAPRQSLLMRGPMPAVDRSWAGRRIIRYGSVVLALLLLACGPFAQFSPGGRGSVPYDPVPIVFDDLPAGDPRAIAVNFAIAQEGKLYTQWPNNPKLSCGRGSATCQRTGPPPRMVRKVRPQHSGAMQRGGSSRAARRLTDLVA